MTYRKIISAGTVIMAESRKNPPAKYETVLRYVSAYVGTIRIGRRLSITPKSANNFPVSSGATILDSIDLTTTPIVPFIKSMADAV